MKNLDELYKWFDENRDLIIANHINECVLIKDKSVISPGSFKLKSSSALSFTRRSSPDFILSLSSL